MKTSITRLSEYAQRIKAQDASRPTKREKREAELSRLAYAVDAINHALTYSETPNN